MARTFVTVLLCFLYDCDLSSPFCINGEDDNKVANAVPTVVADTKFAGAHDDKKIEAATRLPPGERAASGETKKVTVASFLPKSDEALSWENADVNGLKL